MPIYHPYSLEQNIMPEATAAHKLPAVVVIEAACLVVRLHGGYGT